MSLLQRLFATSTGAAPHTKRKIDASRAGYVPRSLGSVVDGRAQLVADAGAHAAAGRYAESLALITTALAATPDDPELLLARASTLYEWGRYREALDGFLRVASCGVQSKTLFLQLGWSC